MWHSAAQPLKGKQFLTIVEYLVWTSRAVQGRVGLLMNMNPMPNRDVNEWNHLLWQTACHLLGSGGNCLIWCYPAIWGMKINICMLAKCITFTTPLYYCNLLYHNVPWHASYKRTQQIFFIMDCMICSSFSVQSHTLSHNYSRIVVMATLPWSI